MRRGQIVKRRDAHALVLDQKMLTHHITLTWDLDRCVGCQLGPLACPKDAITHLDSEITDGRLTLKPSIDVDPEKCVMCGMCQVMCPMTAISMTLNGEPHVPVLAFDAFPELIKSVEFDRDSYDRVHNDFVLENCPTDVISFDTTQETMIVDDSHCIYCRQCEVASDGAFSVVQPWEGTVQLQLESCVEGCLACADICPTRALYVDDQNVLQLADYYCIKCGACVQVCPVEPQIEEYEVSLTSQGVNYMRKLKHVVNVHELPIWVERWRVKHNPIQSGAWVDALAKLADDKASMVEIERKRAIKRRDLIVALKGGRTTREAHRDPALVEALVGSEKHRKSD